MKDQDVIKNILDLIDRRVEEMETGEKIQREYGGVLLDGFDEWFESQRIKRFNIKTGLATLVVTAFVCVAVWRLTPPVDVGAVDKASASQRAELVMATKSVLNQV